MRPFAMIVCWLGVASTAWATVVEDVVPLRAQPFELKDVRLLEGPFKHAQDLQQQWLLE